MSPKTKTHRIPSKTELIQLQKLYRTDEKIGERLGGVPAYLVAYWRRKKNVPKHSLPKFSEREIRTLWERFGDDDQCGLELGLSKAAFYNWRRRYGIREKPAFLKLEQLELDFPGLRGPSRVPSLWGKQTAVQKILARAAGLPKVAVGDQVEVEPDLAVLSENAHQVVTRFRGHQADLVWNAGKVMLTLNGVLGGSAPPTAEERRGVREFVVRQRFKHVFGPNDGEMAQVALERGLILPGQMSLGVGPLVGALGCLAQIAFSADVDTMARLWMKGTVPMEVPASVRVDISGRRARNVSGKDIALAILKRLQDEAVSGRVIEFHGPSLSQMSIGERFTLAALISTTSAAAFCQYDSATRRYLIPRVNGGIEPVVSDKNAAYESSYQITIDQLVPQLAGPDSLQTVRPVAELEDLPVHLIVLGTGVSGRLEDLRIAAEILKGRRVSPDCQMVVLPASRAVYLEALKKGIVRVFSEAGASVLPAGFHRCHLPLYTLTEGERCLSTGLDCDPSLYGTDKAEVYVCSPATAAVSAIDGVIADPLRRGR